MNPTIGRIVHYTLGSSDVDAIRKRREFQQIHGNTVNAGQVVTAVITAIWTPTCVNLQLILDGPDTQWVTSRAISLSGEAQEFHWHWPMRGEPAA